MKFHYRARNEAGNLQKGSIVTSSKEEALRALQEKGLVATSIEEEEREGESLRSVFERIKVMRSIPLREVMMFFRQLSIMVMAKVPLLEALQAVSDQNAHPAFRKKLIDVTRKVEGGTPLSKAMASHSDVFPNFYVSMIRSGEVSGRLSEVLEYLANHVEKEEELRSKVIGALTYPAFVLFVFFVVGVVILTLIIPQLADLFREVEMSLPLATRIVLFSSDFFLQALPFLVILILAAFAGVSYYKKTKEGRELFDVYTLKIPIVGEILKRTYLARISANFSTLVASGITIDESLRIIENIMDNTVYKSILREMKEGVQRGERISFILTRHPDYISPMFIQMIMVGEKTGQLDLVLEKAAVYYAQEVDRAIDKLMRLIEPLMILILGGAVGIVVAAVLIPIYNLIGGGI